MATKNQNGIKPQITLNEDQQAALKLASNDANKFHLFYGGGGSGKSFFILYLIFLRAQRAAGSRHGIFRLTRQSCDKTLFSKTLLEVLDKVWPGYREQLTISLSEMTVTLPNGSIIMFDGLDENRITKVLGDEFNTIWLNECNEFTYKHVSTLLGRLRFQAKNLDNGKLMKNKMFFDCNPRSKKDWDFLAFIAGVNPTDGNALEDHDEWVSCKLNPHSNLAHLGEDYIKTMQSTMSAADRQRYIEGEWANDNPGALFKDSHFNDHRFVVRNGLTPKERLALLADNGVDLERVTVAVDPAVMDDPTSDLSGITVQGVADNGHVYVLADGSKRAHPDEVCRTVAELYREWGASRVVMEKNQGGLWLEAAMRKHFPNVPLKFVNATATTGGKKSRAEPVAVQYERGVVHHVGALKDLEEQMCDFGSPSSKRKSPDRMDAVVWGITELLDLNQESKRPTGVFKVGTSLW